MIIDKLGQYKLLSDYVVRSSYTIWTFPKNFILTITQIDNINRQVIGPELGDWVYWNLPVEKI